MVYKYGKRNVLKDADKQIEIIPLPILRRSDLAA